MKLQNQETDEEPDQMLVIFSGWRESRASVAREGVWTILIRGDHPLTPPHLPRPGSTLSSAWTCSSSWWWWRWWWSWWSRIFQHWFDLFHQDIRANAAKWVSSTSYSAPWTFPYRGWSRDWYQYCFTEGSQRSSLKNCKRSKPCSRYIWILLQSDISLFESRVLRILSFKESLNLKAVVHLRINIQKYSFSPQYKETLLNTDYHHTCHNIQYDPCVMSCGKVQTAFTFYGVLGF